MKVRIVSDGTPVGTTVFTETGEKLTNIAEVTVFIDVRNPVATAILKVVNVEVDLMADVTEQHGMIEGDGEGMCCS